MPGSIFARSALSGRGEIIAADWNDARDRRFDLIFSNPPYIPSAEIADLGTGSPALRTPRRAGRRAGRSGRLSRLAELLPRLLRPGAVAVLELGQGQAERVEPLFRDLDCCFMSHPIWLGIPVFWC